MPEEAVVESHVFAGITFPGRKAVGEILTELERQKAVKRDMVIRSDNFELKVADRQMLLEVPMLKPDRGGPSKLLVPMTRRVFGQLAQWMGIRQTDRLYKWLSVGTQNTGKRRDKTADVSRNWKTWTTLVNDFLRTEKEHRLIRLLGKTDGTPYCRALLSDAYKIVDNVDFFYAVVERLQEAGAEIWHARLSEDKFFGYAVAKGITAQVNTERSFDPGDGWKSRWYGEKNDAFNAAASFYNSETGEGGCGIAQAILRRVCENYCVWQDVINRTHIGRRVADETVLSAETIKKANEVFFLEIRDHVGACFSPEKFQQLVDAMTDATKDEVRDPEKAADALQLCYDLGEERKAAIRNLFIRNSDMSRYGLANAVTEYAHDENLDPEKGFDLEKLGTELINTDMNMLYIRAEKLRKEKRAGKEVEEMVGVGTDDGDLSV